MGKKVEERVLRVASDTNVAKLASSLFCAYNAEPDTPICLRVIGAGALNQAIKGVIIANKQFVKNGKIAYILPSFQNFDDDSNTAIVLRIKVSVI